MFPLLVHIQLTHLSWPVLIIHSASKQKIIEDTRFWWAAETQTELRARNIYIDALIGIENLHLYASSRNLSSPAFLYIADLEWRETQGLSAFPDSSYSSPSLSEKQCSETGHHSCVHAHKVWRSVKKQPTAIPPTCFLSPDLTAWMRQRHRIVKRTSSELLGEVSSNYWHSRKTWCRQLIS